MYRKNKEFIGRIIHSLDYNVEYVAKKLLWENVQKKKENQMTIKRWPRRNIDDHRLSKWWWKVRHKDNRTS